MNLAKWFGRIARGQRLSDIEIIALTKALETMESAIQLLLKFIKPGTQSLVVEELETAAGYVFINDDGITIKADETQSAFSNSYKFKAFDGGYIGRWNMYTDANGVSSEIMVAGNFNAADYGDAYNGLVAYASTSGNIAQTYLQAWMSGFLGETVGLNVTYDRSIEEGYIEITHAYLVLNAWTWAGGAPVSPLTDSAANIYIRASRLIIQWDDSVNGVGYWYLDLAGTSGTWTYTTTPP